MITVGTPLESVVKIETFAVGAPPGSGVKTTLVSLAARLPTKSAGAASSAPRPSSSTSSAVAVSSSCGKIQTGVPAVPRNAKSGSAGTTVSVCGSRRSTAADGEVSRSYPSEWTWRSKAPSSNAMPTSVWPREKIVGAANACVSESPARAVIAMMDLVFMICSFCCYGSEMDGGAARAPRAREARQTKARG